MKIDREPFASISCMAALARKPMSYLRITLTIFLTLWCMVSFSQAKDTLYFYNDTRIVGELLKINLGRAEFDADGIGIIHVKNSKISSIHATSRSFRIETLDGRELQGYLMRSDTAGKILVHAIVESEELPIENISSLLYYGKTVISRITGTVSSGYTYTKSSSIGRLNMDGAVRYNTRKTQTIVNGDMIVTYDSVENEIERANLSVGHEYTFAPLWGAIVGLKYQRNVELGLARRWQQMAGVGRELLLSKHQRASLTAGIAINQERNLERYELNSTEGVFQVNYDLFSFVDPNLTVSFVESSFISITEQDRLRLDGDISIDYEIITNFYISFQFYHNFDSRSPATQQPNIDYGFVAGLRYKF